MLLISVTEYSKGGATWRDIAAELVLKKDTEGLSLKPRGSVLEANKSFTHFLGNSFSLCMVERTKRASPLLWLVKDQTDSRLRHSLALLSWTII